MESEPEEGEIRDRDPGLNESDLNFDDEGQTRFESRPSRPRNRSSHKRKRSITKHCSTPPTPKRSRRPQTRLSADDMVSNWRSEAHYSPPDGMLTRRHSRSGSRSVINDMGFVTDSPRHRSLSGPRLRDVTPPLQYRERLYNNGQSITRKKPKINVVEASTAVLHRKKSKRGTGFFQKINKDVNKSRSSRRDTNFQQYNNEPYRRSAWSPQMHFQSQETVNSRQERLNGELSTLDNVEDVSDEDVNEDNDNDVAIVSVVPKQVKHAELIIIDSTSSSDSETDDEQTLEKNQKDVPTDILNEGTTPVSDDNESEELSLEELELRKQLIESVLISKLKSRNEKKVDGKVNSKQPDAPEASSVKSNDSLLKKNECKTAAISSVEQSNFIIPQLAPPISPFEIPFILHEDTSNSDKTVADIEDENDLEEFLLRDKLLKDLAKRKRTEPTKTQGSGSLTNKKKATFAESLNTSHKVNLLSPRIAENSVSSSTQSTFSSVEEINRQISNRNAILLKDLSSMPVRDLTNVNAARNWSSTIDSDSPYSGNVSKHHAIPSSASYCPTYREPITSFSVSVSQNGTNRKVTSHDAFLPAAPPHSGVPLKIVTEFGIHGRTVRYDTQQSAAAVGSIPLTMPHAADSNLQTLKDKILNCLTNKGSQVAVSKPQTDPPSVVVSSVSKIVPHTASVQEQNLPATITNAARKAVAARSESSATSKPNYTSRINSSTRIHPNFRTVVQSASSTLKYNSVATKYQPITKAGLKKKPMKKILIPIRDNDASTDEEFDSTPEPDNSSDKGTGISVPLPEGFHSKLEIFLRQTREKASKDQSQANLMTPPNRTIESMQEQSTIRVPQESLVSKAANGQVNTLLPAINSPNMDESLLPLSHLSNGSDEQKPNRTRIRMDKKDDVRKISTSYPNTTEQTKTSTTCNSSSGSVILTSTINKDHATVKIPEASPSTPPMLLTPPDSLMKENDPKSTEKDSNINPGREDVMKRFEDTKRNLDSNLDTYKKSISKHRLSLQERNLTNKRKEATKTIVTAINKIKIHSTKLEKCNNIADKVEELKMQLECYKTSLKSIREDLEESQEDIYETVTKVIQMRQESVEAERACKTMGIEVVGKPYKVPVTGNADMREKMQLMLKVSKTNLLGVINIRDAEKAILEKWKEPMELESSYSTEEKGTQITLPCTQCRRGNNFISYGARGGICSNDLVDSSDEESVDDNSIYVTEGINLLKPLPYILHIHIPYDSPLKCFRDDKQTSAVKEPSGTICRDSIIGTCRSPKCNFQHFSRQSMVKLH